MNMLIIAIIATILSDVLYMFYKKFFKDKPKGFKLILILSPVIGGLFSIIFYWGQDFGSLAKGFVIFMLLTILIPLNVLCLKNGFSRTLQSTKETFVAGKKLYEEQKEENKKIKDAIKDKKENSENDKKG